MDNIYQEERKLTGPIELIIPDIPTNSDPLTINAKKAAEEISALVDKMKSKNIPILLMLSGGSALKILEHLNDEALTKNIFGPNITISVLDERYDPDPTRNNWLQINNIEFYKTAKQQRANFIETTPKKTDTLQEFGKRFETAIENWISDHPTGKIIATIGIGQDDKHIAGMISDGSKDKFNKNFVNTEQLIVSYEIDKKYNKFTQRVTPTMKFLTKHIDYAFVLAVNKEKEIKEIFWTEEKHRANLYLAPALILWKMKNIKMYTNTNI